MFAFAHFSLAEWSLTKFVILQFNWISYFGILYDSMQSNWVSIMCKASKSLPRKVRSNSMKRIIWWNEISADFDKRVKSGSTLIVEIIFAYNTRKNSIRWSRALSKVTQIRDRGIVRFCPGLLSPAADQTLREAWWEVLFPHSRRKVRS